MNKLFPVVFLSLAVALTVKAAPTRPMFESRWESLRQDIAAFVDGHFGDSALCPIPSPKEIFDDNNPSDLLIGSFSLSRLGRTNSDHSGPNSFNVHYVSACLTDLQIFLVTQHIDASTLEDLKLWASELPVDARTIKKFETWIDKQNFGSSDNIFNDSDNGGSNNLGDGSSLVAAPEPSTITTFLCGVGLLGGVLLRRRRS
jgi:hypothetical protein